MDNLFLLLLLVSIVALVIGLIKPKLVIRWGDEEKKNRKNVLKVYGLAIVAFFVLFSITLPSNNNEEVSEAEKEVEENIEAEEEVEENIDDEEEVEEKEQKEKEELSSLDELQELYLKLDDLTKEEVEEEIKESELAFNEKEFSSGPSIKVALTDGQAKHRHADGGSHTKISFNKDLEIEVVEYYSNTKNLTLIDYRKGTYWDLRDQPEYAGYYINKPGGSLGSFTVKYDNGNEADTGYLKVDSKEEQLKYLNEY